MIAGKNLGLVVSGKTKFTKMDLYSYVCSISNLSASILLSAAVIHCSIDGVLKFSSKLSQKIRNFIIAELNCEVI